MPAFELDLPAPTLAGIQHLLQTGDDPDAAHLIVRLVDQEWRRRETLEAANRYLRNGGIAERMLVERFWSDDDHHEEHVVHDDHHEQRVVHDDEATHRDDDQPHDTAGNVADLAAFARTRRRTR